MKKRVVLLLAGAALAALLSGGCANKEVVKSEEPLVPKADTSAPKAEYTKPVMKPEEVVPANDNQVSAANTGVSPFETVYFDYDKSDLRKDARDVLSKNADIMSKSRTDKVQIEGHCDERGSAEYNLALGERRAKSVLQYLTTLGVKADRLSIISYGKEKPAVKGDGESAWAKNRRAEFVVSK
ncbi:MAG: peptidoglycan-associated lipoprotein Pal [Desulfuromonadales bacterium]